jgi:hypothetical protein
MMMLAVYRRVRAPMLSGITVERGDPRLAATTKTDSKKGKRTTSGNE